MPNAATTEAEATAAATKTEKEENTYFFDSVFNRKDKNVSR